MSRLAEIQQQFMQYLLTDTASDEHPAVASKITGLVSEQKGISAQHRLQIYANAYRIRLKETIETDHEILGIYLGDELFDKMALEYTLAYPSSGRSLRQFCDKLPDYLQQNEFFKQHPIIADLARFERRLLNAFDAAESERASFADLQALPPQEWPNCTLRFHPSVQIFSCNSNAVEAWQALKADSTPPQADYQHPRAWLLWRGLTRLTELISLTADQHTLLTGFIAGQNFAQQCESMLEWHDEQTAPLIVLQTLQSWFSKGMIRSIVR